MYRTKKEKKLVNIEKYNFMQFGYNLQMYFRW